MSKKLQKNSLPKISIIIPSYNKAKFIVETLESIFIQNYKNLEVIIQDGGSTDGTLKIIKQYSKRFNNLTFESKKDNGQADAINKGLKKATGDIVTFINADDLYCFSAFKEVSNAYVKNKGAMWFAGLGIVVDRNGEEIAKPVTLLKNTLLKLNNYKFLLSVNYLMQPSVFLNQRVFREFGDFSGIGRAVMEYDMWLKIGKKRMPIIIKADLSKFRLLKDAFSASSHKDILEFDLQVVKKYTNNPIILFLHKLGNIGRVGVVKSLKI